MSGPPERTARFPLPAQLDFCPGGVSYQRPHKLYIVESKRKALIDNAKLADDRLRHASLQQTADAPHYLPSLSVLAEAVFGRLTGCSADKVRQWADSMVLAYYSSVPEQLQDNVLDSKPSSVPKYSTVLEMLKTVSNSNQTLQTRRPCGYVFKRDDIAWNCRNCQADPTCVICDDCFRHSDHEGHEVYFHRTSPGGCCDCGDVEAWELSGCCDNHKPRVAGTTSHKPVLEHDPLEAVQAAATARTTSVETLKEASQQLPPRFQAALGVIIGAAVECLVDAVNGSGTGADAVQWKRTWCDEASHIANASPHHEDIVFLNDNPLTLEYFMTANLPENYELSLRLHNDDVHTFDEVIDALHEPPHNRQENRSLVIERDDATKMTHHVDSDGQVTVQTYKTIGAALRGFRRLKSKGLHCAVVSSAQVEAELRARALAAWLSELSNAHPVAQALLVHALVTTNDTEDLGGVHVWRKARMMAPWAAVVESDPERACRLRFAAFPPATSSSYVTREEAELLHGIALGSLQQSPVYSQFLEETGTVAEFYARVPYRIPSRRYCKSPHALWGTVPSNYSDPYPLQKKHPLLERYLMNVPSSDAQNHLSESIYVMDTDLRKQQEGELITTSVYPHKLPGLNMISGIGTIKMGELDARRPPLPSPMELRHLLATSSFRAPLSPILLLLLLDPYPTKQLRGTVHSLILSLLTNGRFKSRFSGAIAVAYRPLSTLFCAGVGTEADTPLHFTVQIFTAGSVVRALCHGQATEKLLVSDHPLLGDTSKTSIGVFVPPIGHVIARCIHTNLLGATKEVNMILTNAAPARDDSSQEENTQHGSISLLPALTYVAGEHPLMTPLPAAPDDEFLDSRSTRHKRLPHLLRDLDYVIETPGTALRLLLPGKYPVYQGPSLSLRGEDILAFPSVFARMLRLAQGMDPQKRKISGGHVEFEHNRWLEAFGLSLTLGGTRDALAESSCAALASVPNDGSHLISIREAVGNVATALLREIKLWLYREGMMETGLPIPPGGAHAAMDLDQLAKVETLQRSTLHVSSSQFGLEDPMSMVTSDFMQGASSSVALACATGVKMTESQLTLIENALKVEAAQLNDQPVLGVHTVAATKAPPTVGPVMSDWLRVPHSPLAGDALSFHLPLHRALAKCIKSVCCVVVPDAIVTANPYSWWKIPVLDDISPDPTGLLLHPLVPLIRATLRSSNCRVVWSAGPDCTPQEAQRRRSRSRTVSANIAVAKVLHSLADHPIRCLAAAQQIERHLWARNGTSVAGMAMNYSSAPLCRSFRDLDLLLVQLSAAGMTCGLGARRVFTLLLNRFSMDGYLCDPERRVHGVAASPSNGPSAIWVNPPRLQDPDHAIVLAEAFFSTLCVLVTELPSPPQTSPDDDVFLRQSIRRELLHALAAEPRTHSEAMTAASCGISRREESERSSGGSGGLFRQAFTGVLNEIGRRKNQSSSRASSGPPAYELRAEHSDEYDPTFFHLRRQEHQHAMDVVARLRKQKWGADKEKLETHCLPVVCAPPRAHPRFLPCRLLLHLDAMDASIRRALLFALTNGSWLPPAAPMQQNPDSDTASSSMATESESSPVTTSISSVTGEAEVPITIFNRRHLQSRSSSGTFPRRTPGNTEPVTFSHEVVASSSVSFLEVLQLLTLQAHTLEECALLHRLCPDLDAESRSLSSGLSINAYLGRLVREPESLVGVWALLPYPDGPLQSSGSGARRGSILGLLITLYEHREDHGAILDSQGEFGPGEEDHGGARHLASSGLKWLLRFVHALVNGAPSVGEAMKSATIGVQVHSPTGYHVNTGTIDEDVRKAISGMLCNLHSLWPKAREKNPSGDKSSDKGKEAGKAAQQRALEMMKKRQNMFLSTISPTDMPSAGNDEEENETDLCIICRCDDSDGDNNGPLGYLGHVQRSRMTQMRSTREWASRDEGKPGLVNTYRVVGHMGCQLRETEAMDSKPLSCLPKGSVVTILKGKVSPGHDILSRRVFVRHETQNKSTGESQVSEGWASLQSSQGYVILSPLVSMCFSNSRWGGTRPVIQQCGHAAHLKCVETHTLSLHHRAAGDQPYDGRFAANISDGEFLCPLCKQLSNILIPRDRASSSSKQGAMDVDVAGKEISADEANLSVRRKLSNTSTTVQKKSALGKRALEDFGSQLYSAMIVPWERAAGPQKKKQDKWHRSIQKWDYEEDVVDQNASTNPQIGRVLRLLRQQLISWSAIGHSAASLEAGARAVEEVLPFGVLSETSEPWPEYGKDCADSHPMLLHMKRMLSGSAGLLELLIAEMSQCLANRNPSPDDCTMVGTCLSNILEGKSWLLNSQRDSASQLAWRTLTAFTASMPSHVARDGTIAQRCEARATASAFWAIRGNGTDASKAVDPPTPLAVRQFEAQLSQSHPLLPSGWGSMNPFRFGNDDTEPFRPGIACSYLYTPLLAWDLYAFSGAALCSIVSGADKDLPSAEELLHLARTLITARIIQAIVTPGGIDVPDDTELDEFDTWSESELTLEGEAFAKLVTHCRETVSNKALVAPQVLVGEPSVSNPTALLAGAGTSILPFARALVLMLRACTAIVRERQPEKFSGDVFDGLYKSELMSKEDGFLIGKVLHCAKPSDIVKDLNGHWFATINRWLIAVIGLEVHHMAEGTSTNSNDNIQGGEAAQAGITLSPERGAVLSDDSTDEMAVDVEETAASDTRFHLSDGEDSDEELEDGLDDAEEMVSLDLALGAAFETSASAGGNTESGDTSDHSSSAMEDIDVSSDGKFANVGRSAVLQFQPTLLGIEGVGQGRHGTMFDFVAANRVMSDLSHLGTTHRRDNPTFTLIRLPKSFVELYNIVNKINGRDDSNAMEESDDVGSSEAAICLLTGAVMRSGSTRRVYARSSRPPGACTLHARKTASGIGIFFLVQKCTVLLMHNNKSAYSPSLYVDEHGEEDPQLRRGRPLFLNEARFRALELLWRQQGIPREVAQIRSTSDRVIRDNWY